MGYGPCGLYSDEILNLELVLEWINNLEVSVFCMCEERTSCVTRGWSVMGWMVSAQIRRLKS